MPNKIFGQRSGRTGREYLTPKAKELRIWKGNSTSTEERQQQHGRGSF